MEIEGLINYFILTVDAYLVRRRNIFALSGKDEADPEQVENFNTEYFENLNKEENELPQSDEV